MKKTIAILLTLALCLGLLAGCGGNTATTGTTAAPASETAGETAADAPAGASAVKTGLYVSTTIADSTNATADEAGQAKYDVTLVAVTVTDDGVIESCVIDSIPATVAFDATGTITSDITAEVPTKNELGDSYGMKAYGGSAYEWNEQVAALAAYAQGKTVEELKNGAVDETGHAADADLASTASIYLGGFVSGIEAAVNNAQHLGAQSGDKLVLATVNSLASSKSADGENEGTAQLDAYITATTMNGDVISSCYIDSVQAKVAFDTTGAITTDLTAPVLTKNELGENYGMKAWGGATYEWNEQAANFASYVTGKTAADVAGIAVNEKHAPADADLAASVTISIGEFQALIAKAAAQ
ncbi:MAG: hypothetical protein PUD80_03950 [Firmicutes bacterium]|nr:hypothetical protein [Bacillota bacterium]